jgi:hypothetical protein
MSTTATIFGAVISVAVLFTLDSGSSALASGPAAPSLRNPQSPLAYGADATGISNSASAFQSAINAGDLVVPAGVFRIDNTVLVPSNRNIRCLSDSALKYTTTGNLAMFEWRGSSAGSVFYCNFRGNNYNINSKPVPSTAFQNFLFIQSVYGKGGGLTHCE